MTRSLSLNPRSSEDVFEKMTIGIIRTEVTSRSFLKYVQAKSGRSKVMRAKRHAKIRALLEKRLFDSY